MRDFEKTNRNWTYSYSGSDCRVYIRDESGEIMLLNSLSTASISLHEAKSPVRTLGRRSVVGFTESLRTIAGSLVFVVLEDHPLGNLKSHILENDKNYSKDWKKNYSSSYDILRKKATTLNPVDLYFVYKTETDTKNSGSDMWVTGVRFINEGVVTSVNDMVTEIVMQFVAEDMQPLEYKYSEKENKRNRTENEKYVEYIKDLERNKTEGELLNDLTSKPIISNTSNNVANNESGRISITNADKLLEATKNRQAEISNESFRSSENLKEEIEKGLQNLRRQAFLESLTNPFNLNKD